MQITNSPLPELHPSWSPDGRRLVYCRLNTQDGRGELWIADLERPGVKRLIGEGLFPSWSPRGDKIAYQRARQRGSRWFSIWTLTLQNDEPSLPTEVAHSPDAALIAPTWSPDGAQIAFASIAPGDDQGPLPGQPRITGQGRADIGIIDADGRGMVRLTNGRGDNFSPCWAADGRIYFTARLARSETIWSIRPFTPSAPSAPVAAPELRRAAHAARLDPEG
jgi:TolB protein